MKCNIKAAMSGVGVCMFSVFWLIIGAVLLFLFPIVGIIILIVEGLMFCAGLALIVASFVKPNLEGKQNEM